MRSTRGRSRGNGNKSMAASIDRLGACDIGAMVGDRLGDSIDNTLFDIAHMMMHSKNGKRRHAGFELEDAAADWHQNQREFGPAMAAKRFARDESRRAKWAVESHKPAAIAITAALVAGVTLGATGAVPNINTKDAWDAWTASADRIYSVPTDAELISEAERDGDRFVQIDGNGRNGVVVDTQTGVEYLHHSGSILYGHESDTPLLRKDGKPVVNSDWERLHGADTSAARESSSGRGHGVPVSAD